MTSPVTIAPNTNWLKPIVSPSNASLDIIAVHGMNLGNNSDHADGTWTDTMSGTNWLRDLLPSRVPNARILAYQYNANVAFGTSSAGVEEQARNMLHCLWLERKSHSARPIIFIAHSMGGIIVKEALAIAYHGDGTYAMISTITYGIVFFGVPHRGSEHARWGRIAARIIGTAGQLNGSFLNSVESGSAYNKILTAKFKPLLERYRFFSICETLSEVLDGIDFGIIVPKDSAILDLPDHQEVKLFPNRSHRTICKFTSAVEPEWKQVSDIICHAATCAVNNFDYSPTVLERKKMFKDFSWHLEDTEEQTVTPLQAIDQAQSVLMNIKDGSECSFQLREILKQVDSLNGGVIALAAWFWSIIQPILMFVPIYMASTLLLPNKVTIMDKAEGARRSQQEVVELERLAIEALDIQRYRALQAIGMLQTASESEPVPTEQNMGADQLALVRPLRQELDKQAERIVRELHRRHQAYSQAEVKLKLIEEGQRVAVGKDDREFWMCVAERAPQAKNKLEEALAENADYTCPQCVIL